MAAPADPNAFTGAALDRALDGRRADEGWVAARRDDPRALALVAGSAGVRACDGRLELAPMGEALAAVGATPSGEAAPPPGEAAAPAGTAPVLLGLDPHGRPLWAIDEDPPPPRPQRPAFIGAGGRRGEPAPPAEGRLALRDAASLLDQAQGGLLAYAAAMLNWHRGHRFCPNCGSATDVREGGTLRACPACRLQHHPRVDPVVIMLVTDDGADRVLLGRQRAWPARRYSALAGFVGAGESLEEAVEREVFEEVGVEVGPPAYASSQPWPFPASLMLGFTVPWQDGEIGGSDPELQDARWFTRAEVATAASLEPSWDGADEGDGLLLPPRSAIARRLIEGWLA